MFDFKTLETKWRTEISRDFEYINRLIYNLFLEYPTSKQCFLTHEENDDFYDLLLDLSNKIDIPETDLYYIYIESKYPLKGKILVNTLEEFITKTTILQIK